MESESKDKEERKARLAAEKAKLNELLAESKIDGVEYNRQLIALMTPEKPKAKPAKLWRPWELIVVIVILIIAAIPTAINLNWHFYFQNTLTASGMPDYSKVTSSVNDGPIQIELDEYIETGEYKGRPIKIVYEAYYDITGVVTSVRDYWGLGAYDTLVPRDVCMVWGSLADNYQKQEVDFSQGKRNCKPRIDGVEIDDLDYSAKRGRWGGTVLVLHEFSNNHIIASTPEVRQAVFDLKTGDTVRFTGYLVRVVYDNIILSSSLTREDSGDGACEVFYVTSVSPVFNAD